MNYILIKRFQTHTVARKYIFLQVNDSIHVFREVLGAFQGFQGRVMDFQLFEEFQRAFQMVSWTFQGVTGVLQQHFKGFQ